MRAAAAEAKARYAEGQTFHARDEIYLDTEVQSEDSLFRQVRMQVDMTQGGDLLARGMGVRPGAQLPRGPSLDEQVQQARAMGVAAASIDAILENPETTRYAHDILSSFRTGEGPRLFTIEYDARSLDDLYSNFELFNDGPSHYFRQEVNELIDFAVAKYDRGYLQDGDSVTGYSYRDFGFQRRSILPETRDVLSLRDGAASLGDVVGTMHGGWNLSVRSGNMYITATNLTSLESYAAGNFLSGLGVRGVSSPTSGPFSTVRQEFTFVVPVPSQLRPPAPASRRGQ